MGGAARYFIAAAAQVVRASEAAINQMVSIRDGALSRIIEVPACRKLETPKTALK
jgi:hypothetical protein